MTATSSDPAFGPDEVGVLDYPHRKIVIQITNAVEATYRQHCWEKETWTCDFIDAIPEGSVFYDVGACVGSYALIAATRGLTTIAVEPSAPNYGALVRNAMLNNCLESMLVLPVALAAGRGLAWLDYQDVRAGAASHVLGSPDKLFYHRQRVIIYGLDEMIEAFRLPVPTHMKIDTDGGEGSVLAGMDATLRSERLTGLMIEMPRQAEAKIAEHLAERGWQLIGRFDTREGVPIDNVVYGQFGRPVVAKAKRSKKAVAAA